MKRAVISWSEKNKSWVIRVETEDGWELYQEWMIKDEAEDGSGWVNDGMLCELANLQSRGYQILINIY